MERRISVVIPNYNSADTIGKCLRAVFASKYSNFEVIVVDDFSTDNSVEIIKTFPCRLICLEERSGTSKARNTGAQESAGEFIFFTDADCQPHRDWIERMLAPFDDPGVTGVKGVYHTQQHSTVARFVQAEHEEKYDRLIHEEGLTPIARWGTPDDVGRAVVAVATDLLPFSTGSVIDVDGGFHLRTL